MSDNSRRVTFVDKQVQGALVRRVLVHWACFIVVSLFSASVLQVLLGDPTNTVSENIQEAVGRYSLFGLILVALLPAFLLDTVRLSNRFAGPVMRLRRALRQLADGDEVAELRFRDNDYWQEIARDFNKATARLREEQSATENNEELSQPESQTLAS